MLERRQNLYSCISTTMGLFVLMFLLVSAVGITNAREIEVFEGQKVQVPDIVPDYSSWQAAFPRLFPEGLIAVVYDNPATPDIKEDLTEMYDLDNRLLSIGWYDKFGVYQMILDSGLLTKEKNLTGIFRMIQDVNNTI
ncbi:MAG: hypothetical protein SVY10_15590 [Thermodesulfobacteriota bacterium]|nr:hypothetical protein [Thermodesulfobacteriota bacterium]